MMICRIQMALLCATLLVSAPAVASAGNIKGVVQELNGTPIVGATITVTDLATGRVVGTAQSVGGGAFSIDLPNGSAVSVTFTDGVHLPAALIGISGNTVLNNFPIFMPVADTCQSSCTMRGCCQVSRCHVRSRGCRF